jgi:tRNA G18 (ribose-2'-O)-methylase SpoU
VPRFIALTDPADPCVEPYRDIRERDLVGRQGMFIAEGEVVLRLLARQAGFEAVSVLIDARRREKLSPILEELPEDTPVFLAAQALLDTIAGFQLHRGILALGRRVDPPEAEALLAGLGEKALVLALSGIANHDNMGGLFRNAAAFGVEAVVLDSDCCDPLYRKAIRVSVGGVLVTPFARLGPGVDLVGLLKRSGLEPVALSPSGQIALSAFAVPERAALIAGAEGPGLSDAILTQCRTVSIPMAAGFDSLNVATAAGIALHHLRAGQGTPADVLR